jgi:hypothetical protein
VSPGHGVEALVHVAYPLALVNGMKLRDVLEEVWKNVSRDQRSTYRIRRTTAASCFRVDHRPLSRAPGTVSRLLAAPVFALRLRPCARGRMDLEALLRWNPY